MLDQARFRLLSGSSMLDGLSIGDFETVYAVLEGRLLSALCLAAVPPPPADETVNNLWDQLIADALSVSVKVKQDDGIKSESMRNYSYTFQDYANTWEMLNKKSGDLLAKFNACDTGITMQTNLADRIYGYEYGCGGCGGCHECI